MKPRDFEKYRVNVLSSTKFNSTKYKKEFRDKDCVIASWSSKRSSKNVLLLKNKSKDNIILEFFNLDSEKDTINNRTLIVYHKPKLIKRIFKGGVVDNPDYKKNPKKISPIIYDKKEFKRITNKLIYEEL